MKNISLLLLTLLLNSTFVFCSQYPQESLYNRCCQQQSQLNPNAQQYWRQADQQKAAQSKLNPHAAPFYPNKKEKCRPEPLKLDQ